MKKFYINLFGAFAGLLILSSILISLTGVYVTDGTRKNHRYTIPIMGEEKHNLVYYEWEPMKGSPDRAGHVVFCFAGFLAQQPMMYPLMREFTRQGYHVVTGDFRGHGESQGTFTMNWNVLLDDFDQIYNAVKSRHSDQTSDAWNMTHVAVCGHSMGGFASILFGYKRDYVFTSIAFAPAAYQGNINATRPQNLMIIIGSKDQAFTEQVELSLFRKAVPNGQIGKLYGDPQKGTSKKMVVAPWARHESELVDDYCLSQAVSFVEMGFGDMMPGDDFLANQERRVAWVENAMYMGLIGICLLFLYINQLDWKFKLKESMHYKILFNKITGNIDEMKISIQKAKKDIQDEIEVIKSKIDSSNRGNILVKDLKNHQTLKKLKERLEENKLMVQEEASHLSVPNSDAKKFLKDWFLGLPFSILGASLLFFTSFFIIKDVFSNLQILIVAIPGLSNLWIIWINYRRQKRKEKKLGGIRDFQVFGAYLKPLWLHINLDFSITSIIAGFFMYGLSMFIILIGYGQTYIFLFPLNQRIFNFFFLAPIIFIMMIIQSMGYITHLVDRLRDEKYGFWKSLGILLFTKHFIVYVAGIVFLIMGKEFYTLLFLLIVIDLIVTILLLINYWINLNRGAIIIWAVLLITTVYLGYSGVINGWEVFFGPYTASYWVG
ncbi:MAG: alpha/beta hydrolase [Promethearchaeota archaeon]